MIRKRLATLAAIAGLGLTVGCSNSRMACSDGCTTSSSGFLSRLTGRARTVAAAPVVELGAGPSCCSDAGPSCCSDAGPSCCDGPMLMDHGPVISPVPSFPSAPYGTPGLVPGSVPMAPPPRLVPEPQAQARPYNP